MSFTAQLLSAFRNDIADKVKMSEQLELLDERVAKAAMSAFENPLGAAQWLTTPSVAFEGQIPLTVVESEEGRSKVILELTRIGLGIAT